MVAKLVELGYVKESLSEAIRAREEKYPTALPTQPEAIAIPHSDVEHIIKPFIAPTRLMTPVDWREMGNDENVHPVRYIFMLGFLDKDGHVDVLQVLLKNFMDPVFMASLDAASSEDEFYEAVMSIKSFEEN